MELPYIPSDIPFTGDQKAWFSGFMAGLNTRMAMPTGVAEAALAGTATSTLAPEGGPGPLLIAYGTQTGNAEMIAEQAAEAAAGLGFSVRVADMGDLTVADVAAASKLLVVVSTYGEGDMPDNAEDLWEQLADDAAPRMEGLRFAVCGLGDSIYDGFCQAAKNLDGRLFELGAQRLVDRVECDVDFQRPADAWLPGALQALADAPAAGAVAAAPAPVAAASSSSSDKVKWGRKNPYPATILANSVLSGPTSAKEVRHLVISLGDSGIEYQPGDGISIVAENDGALVDLLLARIGATGDELITDRKAQRTLREALTSHYEISTPSKYLVDYVAKRTGDPELTHLMETGDPEALDAWLWGRDVLDVLNVDPAMTMSPEELIGELRPLAPRVYSISSSPEAHNGTVHITMATVRYTSDNRERGGVCSTYLADRRGENDEVQVYITPNKAFRLPQDDAPVIMIGPGTGIAPFRSFLHERAARGATGDNWLFFGDQHRDSDFLYEAELDQFLSDGLLSRLDLAFSRDQEHKVYVQDRMRDQGENVYRWLERGAHVYVCGDANRMAHDVDQALTEIVAQHGGMDAEKAGLYVSDLKKEKRYCRDVY
ncbi:MAG: sulfite reductase subunit alpha [Gordonia sp. (in: high G+C Gram-positive bacteria)]|uniref:sulfite reductase subunit alpha n=1 Tax=Gordonia sp. (in: high G+C Gram-positive bacteria) TaxID=84139 RepID=UPI0039E64158